MKLVCALDGKDHLSTWDVENLYISYQRYYVISLFLTLLICFYNSISEIYENEKWVFERI